MKNIKKRYYILGTIVLIILIVLFFLSSVIKNYINNNSQELIGRKVELSELHINYLRVAVQAKGLRVYEANETDVFAGFKEFYVNFDPTKLFSNTYSFSSIKVDSLFANVIKDGDDFNFSDLIPPADSTAIEEVDTTSSASSIRFAIHNIQLLHGNIRFYDNNVDNEIKMDDVSLELPLIAWDSKSSNVGVEFEFGQRGKVYIGAKVDQVNSEYNVDFRVDKLALNDISSYVEDAIDAGGIEGFVNANLNIKGSLEETTNVIVSGQTSVDTFRIWDLENKDVFKLDNVSVGLKSLDVGNMNYHISDIHISKPVISASLYKDMSNIERMLLPVTQVDSTSIVEETASDSLATDSITIRYRVDKLVVDNGELLFADNTLYRPFLYDFKNINISIDSISESAENVPVSFAVNMNDQGKLAGTSSINVVNPTNLNLTAKVERLRLLSFSPYTEYHIARPITQGEFNYDLSVNMTPTHMTNTNDIVIKELEIGEKTSDEPQVKAPVKLGLYLMKDPKDMITINMPVEGNPSDPDFSVSKLVWKAFSNLLIKVAASPFNALGNLVGTRPEELENIPFPYGQDSLRTGQRETLDKIAEILEKKPQLSFSFEQQTDPEQEKNAMAVNMAKKEMLAQKMALNTPEQITKFNQRLLQLEDTDESFLNYLRSNVSGAETMSLHQACTQLIGNDRLTDEFNKLLMNRNETIRFYLLDEKGIDSTSIEVNTADLRNLPEELKNCNYKVEVSIK